MSITYILLSLIDYGLQKALIITIIIHHYPNRVNIDKPLLKKKDKKCDCPVWFCGQLFLVGFIFGKKGIQLKSNNL